MSRANDVYVYKITPIKQLCALTKSPVTSEVSLFF